jgi:hypothetical protein
MLAVVVAVTEPSTLARAARVALGAAVVEAVQIA